MALYRDIHGVVCAHFYLIRSQVRKQVLPQSGAAEYAEGVQRSATETVQVLQHRVLRASADVSGQGLRHL